MKPAIAALVGVGVKTVAQQWATRHSIDPWIAHVLSGVAGAVASAAVMRL